jgi:hypothetical protein
MPQIVSAIVVSPETTSLQALEMAYKAGRALNPRRAKDMNFVHELSEHIHLMHATNPLVRFLRIGFAAGFFGKDLPDVDRVTGFRPPEYTGDRGRMPRRPKIRARKTT